MMADNDVDADPLRAEKKHVKAIVAQMKQILKDAETSGYGDTAEGKALVTKFKALQAQIYKYSNTEDAHRIGEYNHKGGYVSDEFRQLVWRSDLVQSVWYERIEAEKERIEALKPKPEPEPPAPKPKRKVALKKKAVVPPVTDDKPVADDKPVDDKKTIILTDTIPDVVFFNDNTDLTDGLPTLVVSELNENTIVSTVTENDVAPDDRSKSLPPSTIAIVEAQRKADKMTPTVNTHWNPDSIPLIRDALTNMGRKLRSTDKKENDWFEVSEADGRVRPYIDSNTGFAYTQEYCDDKIAMLEVKINGLSAQIKALEDEAYAGKYNNVSAPMSGDFKKRRNLEHTSKGRPAPFKDETDEDNTLYNKYMAFSQKIKNLQIERTNRSGSVSDWKRIKTLTMTWLPERIVQFSIRYNDHDVPKLREFFKANDKLPFYNQLSQLVELRHEDMTEINKGRANPIRNVYFRLQVTPAELYISTTWEVMREGHSNLSKGTEYNLGVYGDTVVRKFKSMATIMDEQKQKEEEDAKALDKVVGPDGLVHREKGGWAYSFKPKQKQYAKYDSLWSLSHSFDWRSNVKKGSIVNGLDLEKVVSNYTTKVVRWSDDRTRSWETIEKDPSVFVITGYKENEATSPINKTATLTVAGYTYSDYSKEHVEATGSSNAHIVFSTPALLDVKMSKKSAGWALPDWVKPMPYDKDTDYSVFK